jgi:glycosyltransferase involved in cell wall biosynthesis
MAGLPVVATRVGELPDLITPQTGCLVPPAQPQALQEALLALLSSPEQRAALGRAGAELARREYNLSTWMDRLLAVYVQAGVGE